MSLIVIPHNLAMVLLYIAISSVATVVILVINIYGKKYRDAIASRGGRFSRRFAHPSGNGYIEDVGFYDLIVLWAIGPLYLLLKARFADAIVMFIANAIILDFGYRHGNLFLVAVGYYATAWVFYGRYCSGYLKRGWAEVID
ncbi:MAG TPA: hypothetical protein VK196_05250 [Magnetospirillum sp.]|nr:hypothetical protein [Magnetospirillum sp.]